MLEPRAKQLIQIATGLLLFIFVGWFGGHSELDARNAENNSSGLSLDWENNILTIRGSDLPGKELKVWYLEAYCRPNSTDREWGETTIGHKTRLLRISPNKRQLELQCKLSDGVEVHHTITAGKDEVDFLIVAHNPTRVDSQAHWAQPCVRVEKFTGAGQEGYLSKSFIFVDGQLARLPTHPWATQARYVPGQVWCPRDVPRSDVNPRPLSTIVPSNGLIGSFSKDEKKVLAIAFEPYQELFQGVIVCLHSDFRIGGLTPGQTKKIRGKIYLMENDIPKLLARYEKDFPEQAAK
jgi:hypothetical protein